jgi:hypothetical protein
MPATIRFALPVAVLLATATAARAQSEPAARRGNSQAQLALVDAVSLGAATAGLVTGREGFGASNLLWGVGGVGTFVGGPVVHLVNHEFGLAGVSVAMRLAFPVIGAVIGGRLATCTPEQSLCGLDEAAQGFAVGAATAASADNALTALVNATASASERRSTPPPPAVTVRLLPRLVAAPNVAMVGVGGLF